MAVAPAIASSASVTCTASAAVASVSVTFFSCVINFSMKNFSDLCPKPNETQNELSKQSYTDELEGIPEYFTTIAGGGTDVTHEWQTFTFPVDYDASLYGDKLDRDIKYVMRELLKKN